MIEIVNKTKSPVQLTVRSKTRSNAFTTLIVPSIGAGKNKVLLPEELMTEYVYRLRDEKLISIKKI